MSAGSDTYETLLEEATKGLAEARRMMKEEPAKWRAANPFLPPMIPVKDGSHFITGWRSGRRRGSEFDDRIRCESKSFRYQEQL